MLCTNISLHIVLVGVTYNGHKSAYIVLYRPGTTENVCFDAQEKRPLHLCMMNYNPMRIVILSALLIMSLLIVINMTKIQ